MEFGKSVFDKIGSNIYLMTITTNLENHQIYQLTYYPISKSDSDTIVCNIYLLLRNQ